MTPEVCVVGLGYIGLPTACLFASSGVPVHGVDVDPLVISNLKKGHLSIQEPDLQDLLDTSLRTSSLTFSDTVQAAQFFIICVPTPISTNSSKPIPSPDLSYVKSAALAIANYVQPGNTIILESTSPVGTTELVKSTIKEQISFDADLIHFAYCPERVIPGTIVYELINNQRIIGGLTSLAARKAGDLYRKIVSAPLNYTTARVAELCKLAENSFRDINIAFANELSLVCAEYSVDPCHLIELANLHPRVNILQPGIGVGGHCIPIDPWFIASQLPDTTPLIQQARRVNLYKTKWVQQQIMSRIDSMSININPIKVSCLGLSYKPNVGDFRESPALLIAQGLSLLDNVQLTVVEPHIETSSDFALTSLAAAIDESHLLILLVAHDDFTLHNLPKHRLLDFTGTL